MDDGVVDTSASEGNFRQNLFFGVPVRCEEIESQRFFVLFCQTARLLQGAEGENRQDGSEEFFLHDGIFR